jgi:hypothetical protein
MGFLCWPVVRCQADYIVQSLYRRRIFPGAVFVICYAIFMYVGLNVCSINDIVCLNSM